MKKMSTKKKIILSLSIVLGIILIAGLGFFITMTTAMNSFTPVETGEIINETIYAVDDGSNFYLIKNGDEYIAIDAGDESEASLQELKKLDINPDDVTALFLTHTDGDHIGAVNIFENAKIYLPKDEEQMINGAIRRGITGYNKFDYPYETIDNNEILNIGGIKIRGIANPGHTLGSMSYLVDDKYLFTGDAISIDENNKVDVQMPMSNMDNEMSIESVKILKSLETVEYIFTGHYGYSTEFVFE